MASKAMTKLDFIQKISQVYRTKTPGKCQLSGEVFSEENTPNENVRYGYQIRIMDPENPGRAIGVEVCRKVYLEWYKAAYPEAPTPKLK